MSSLPYPCFNWVFAFLEMGIQIITHLLCKPRNCIFHSSRLVETITFVFIVSYLEVDITSDHAHHSKQQMCIASHSVLSVCIIILGKV